MKKLLFYFMFFSSYIMLAQDLTQIGKAKLFTLGGGVSANSVYYDGSGQRDPFTYILNGNINLNISGIYNIPLSFAYSNQEFNFSQPFRFNRLSLHPSYKWITAHIGDVAMTFSPYTLSGHQFRGLGVDATPTSKLKLSAMYGRLIRANEFDLENPQSVPAFERIGYGFKSAYDFDKFSIGATLFAAQDQEKSVTIPIPVEAGVNPQENLVISIDGKVKLFKKVLLSAEFAQSGITEDTRVSGSPGNEGAISLLFQGNATTQYYNAFNTQLSLSAGNGSVGVSYERIDPKYRTLGAYFFNNDLENIAVNASQTILKDKVNIAINAGLQRDNLDDSKASELQRIVAAVNLNVKASEKLNISGSYSNFQSVTNIRDQFDFINQVTPFDNIDTLNYRQLSRNATLNISYAISKSEKKVQNASVNLSMQDTEDLQEQFLTGDQTTVGATTFFNTGGNYSLNFVPIDFTITTGVNASFNTTQETENTVVGPTLALSKLFLDKKLRSSFAASYNQSSTDGVLQNTILNFRVNAGYQLLEKHQFNLSILSLFRNNLTATSNAAASDFTATLGYNYTFTTTKKRKQPGQENKKVNTNDGSVAGTQFRYKGQIFEGDAVSLDNQILALKDKDAFATIAPAAAQKIREAQETMLQMQSNDSGDLKEAAINYAELITAYNEFDSMYQEALFIAVLQLKEDARFADDKIEREFVSITADVYAHEYKGKPIFEILDTTATNYASYKTLYETFQKKRQGFVNHRYMLEQLTPLKKQKDVVKDTHLNKFKTAQVAKVYEAYQSIEKNAISLSTLLTGDLIIYYQNLAKQFANPEEYTFKYIPKN